MTFVLCLPHPFNFFMHEVACADRLQRMIFGGNLSFFLLTRRAPTTRLILPSARSRWRPTIERFQWFRCYKSPKKCVLSSLRHPRSQHLLRNLNCMFGMQVACLHAWYFLSVCICVHGVIASPSAPAYAWLKRSSKQTTYLQYIIDARHKLP